jgi:hypothetical protein
MLTDKLEVRIDKSRRRLFVVARYNLQSVADINTEYLNIEYNELQGFSNDIENMVTSKIIQEIVNDGVDYLHKEMLKYKNHPKLYDYKVMGCKEIPKGELWVHHSTLCDIADKSGPHMHFWY